MIKKLIYALCAFVLVACGTGNNSAIISPTYGQLISYTQGQSLATTFLQSYLANPSSSTTGTGVCQNASGSYESLICLNNINYVNSKILQNSNLNVTTMVQSNIANITTITPYQIIYNTPGASFHYSNNVTVTQNVSGVVLLPNIPISQINGVILFYHQTILSKNDIPSNFNSIAGADISINLASVYASQGYIVIAPDYVGQGINTNVMHPYAAFPQTNALSGLYMLGALNQLLNKLNLILPASTKLYISSYSEGAPYAFWASKMIQNNTNSIGDFVKNNNFALRRTIGISGAYDLSNTTFNFEYTNLVNSPNQSINPYNVSPGCIVGSSNFCTNASYPYQLFSVATSMAQSKTALSSYILAAYSYYNFNNSGYNIVLQPNFVNLNQCLNLSQYLSGGNISIGTCALPYDITNIFTSVSSNLTQSKIASQIFSAASGFGNGYTTPSGYFTNNLLESQLIPLMVNSATQGGTQGFYNDVGYFVNRALPQDPAISTFMKQSDIYSWVTTSPLSLLFLKYDSTVTNLNSYLACGANGVKGLSQANMVNCVSPIDNTNLFTVGVLGVPLYMDHGDAFPVLLLSSLVEIINNP